MITIENDVTDVMNCAIQFLQDAEMEITPQNHYDMLTAWYESFFPEMTHPVSVATKNALFTARARLLVTLNTPL